MKITNIITKEKIDDYLERTQKALKKVKITAPKGTHKFNVASDFLDMATRYFSDAKYFYSQGDYVNAFAAVNYAHAWLDAGAREGLFDVGHDSTLFTVD